MHNAYIGSSLSRTFICALIALHSVAIVVHAQAPVPVERVTFQQAIDRAIKNNPAIASAAAGILRAEGLLSQARSATLLQVTGAVQTTTLNRGVEFEGATVTPRHQITSSLTIDMPIVAAADWARRAQAQDNRAIADLSATETRRQIALATADAYLSIIAQRRVLEGNVRARALRSRDRARTAGDRQPPERPARPAAAVDVRAAARIGDARRLPRAGGARRARRGRRSGRCGR